MKTTFDVLRDIMVRDYELAPERLQPETPLADIDVDSLAVMELVFSLEDEFNVTAGDTDSAFETLGDVAMYIDRLIAERDAGLDGDSPAATGAAARE
ncbi:MAG: phosphopantetheine-binding protein [Woeseia sp.]